METECSRIAFTNCSSLLNLCFFNFVAKKPSPRSHLPSSHSCLTALALGVFRLLLLPAGQHDDVVDDDDDVML